MRVTVWVRMRVRVGVRDRYQQTGNPNRPVVVVVVVVGAFPTHENHRSLTSGRGAYHP